LHKVSQKHKQTLKHRLGNVAKGVGAAYIGYSAALGAHYDYKTTKSAIGGAKKWAAGGGASRAAQGLQSKIGGVASHSAGAARSAFNAVKNSAGRVMPMAEHIGG
jgi:hypothetical protein